MNISSVVSGFNPPWYREMMEQTAFDKAVDFASNVLKNTVSHKVATIKARKYVVEAYNNRTKKEVVILNMFYPWERTLSEIDSENEVLFVIYPKDGQYLLQTVRERGRGRINKKSLPASWAGKRDDDLGRIIGIEDAIFCHPARFIAGAKSLESILKMADMAIDEPEPTII
jgi:uncharacterized UPF0160 family protein